MSGGFEWTPARVRELARRWAAGESASTISRALEAPSRCAVLGKAFRLGLARRSALAQAVAGGIEGRRGLRRLRGCPPAAVQAAVRVVDYTGPGAVIEQVTGCLYPVGERGGEHLFCDRPRVARRPYCAVHQTLTAAPAPDDALELERLAARFGR